MSIKCNCCNRECKNNNSLATHIIKSHGISIHEYYDIFMKKSDEGICLECKSPTKFVRLADGYRTFCSNKCSQTHQANNTEMKMAKIKKMKSAKLEKYGDENYSNWESGKKTCIKKYGVENPFQAEEVKKKMRKTWKKKYGHEHHIFGKKRRMGEVAWKKYMKNLSVLGVRALKDAQKNVTSLEKRYYSLLDMECIKYEPQYELEFRWFDAYLPDYGVLMEFDGDFWHKDSIDECKYDFQKKSYKSDQHKNEIAKKHGLRLIRIKESKPVKSILNLIEQ